MSKLFLAFVIAAANVLSGVPVPAQDDPGESRDRICRPGFSRSIRPPEWATDAVKYAMLRAKGIPENQLAWHAQMYELDHIVPLCLDGPPLDEQNLQLQLWPAAHEKDKREAAACRAYCEGEITLEEARSMFHRDADN